MLAKPVVVRATINLYTQVVLGNEEVNSLNTCLYLLHTLGIDFFQPVDDLVLEGIFESLAILKLAVKIVKFTHLILNFFETNELGE